MVNNVETLINVPGIILRRRRGIRQARHAKTPPVPAVLPVGPRGAPGVYEVAIGATLRATDRTGRRRGRQRRLQAVLLGGAAGAFVDPAEMDTPLTFEGTRAIGATLGSGVIMLFDDTVDLRRILLRIAVFFRHETCGQCVPCRVGVVRQQEALQRLVNAQPLGSPAQEIAMLREMGQAMRDASICGLGQTASSALESALQRWNLFS